MTRSRAPDWSRPHAFELLVNAQRLARVHNTSAWSQLLKHATQPEHGIGFWSIQPETRAQSVTCLFRAAYSTRAHPHREIKAKSLLSQRVMYRDRGVSRKISRPQSNPRRASSIFFFFPAF
eukprot:3811857-Rhodomonas_salina.4